MLGFKVLVLLQCVLAVLCGTDVKCSDYLRQSGLRGMGGVVASKYLDKEVLPSTSSAKFRLVIHEDFHIDLVNNVESDQEQESITLGVHNFNVEAIMNGSIDFPKSASEFHTKNVSCDALYNGVNSFLVFTDDPDYLTCISGLNSQNLKGKCTIHFPLMEVEIQYQKSKIDKFTVNSVKVIHQWKMFEASTLDCNGTDDLKALFKCYAKHPVAYKSILEISFKCVVHTFASTEYPKGFCDN